MLGASSFVNGGEGCGLGKQLNRVLYLSLLYGTASWLRFWSSSWAFHPHYYQGFACDDIHPKPDMVGQAALISLTQPEFLSRSAIPLGDKKIKQQTIFASKRPNERQRRDRLLFRREHHNHLPSLHFRVGFDLCKLIYLALYALKQLRAKINMRHLTTTETQGDFYLITGI